MVVEINKCLINGLIDEALHTIPLFFFSSPVVASTFHANDITSNKLLLLLPDTYNTSLSVTEPEYFVPGKTYPAPGVWKN